MARASDFEQEDDERTRRRSGSKRKRNKSSTHRRNRHRRRIDTEETANETESDCPPSDSSRKITDEALKDYLGKKAHKKALQVAKKLKTQTILGYTNDSNPFGDANLTEKFVWRKKIEKDLTKGLDPRALSLKSEKKRQMERMAEIEKVKKRREERAIEKAQHEEEMAMLARERARAEFQDWEKKEEEFHFEQSKVRSEIRLREGRAKPIDVLSKNLNLSDDFDIEINEPYKIYQGLTVKKMEELQIDIKMHLELDRATPTHVEFWEAMMVVCDWEISEARKRDVLDRARVRGEEPPPELVAEDMGLHVSVDADVKTTLQSRNFNELDKLQTQIEAQMRSGIAEVEFWEAILKRLHISKAKARLRQIHADLLRQHLQRLQDSDVDSDEKKHHASQGEQHVNPADTDSEEPGQYSPKLSTEARREAVAKEAEEELESLSPELVQDYAGDEVVDPETDKADLERKRAEVLEEQQRRLQEAAVGPNVPGDDSQELTGPERNLALKVMSSIEEGDAILGIGSEINLESQVYWWHDNYRPRKPKYFNRIHTGYEWNKYNQTHYDHDNPPPKIVQGYKFNIFYPDLVDKTKAPTSEIEKDGSTGETCLIRFHAGPPYEDIAFRIVNKDWEYSHKKGFKCRFERGILHVYFNFKRYRYRR